MSHSQPTTKRGAGHLISHFLLESSLLPLSPSFTIMFFGASLKPGAVCTPTESDGGKVLHLSQVCLVNPTSNDKTYLQISHDGKNYCLCALQKDNTENVTLDLFISTQSCVKFQTTGGKNEVHIIGYFEPNDDEESDVDDGDEEMIRRLAAVGKADRDDDDESGEEGEHESDDEKATREAVESLIHAKLSEKAKAGKVEVSDDDEDDDDEEEEEIGEGEKEEESDEEDSEDIEPPVQPQQVEEKKKESKVTLPQAESGNKKRKAEVPVGSPLKPAKQQKIEKTDASLESQWEKSVVAYLKKNGRQPISNLAAKVKKPDSVKLKYGAFLKSRPKVFNIEGQNVSLKA